MKTRGKGNRTGLAALLAALIMGILASALMVSVASAAGKETAQVCVNDSTGKGVAGAVVKYGVASNRWYTFGKTDA
jgi:hypothetical protein